MDKEILHKYNELADTLVARYMRYLIFFIVFAGVANLLHLFIIDQRFMLFAVITSCIGFFIPTVLFDFLKWHGSIERFVSLGILCLMVGCMYAMLSYHVVLMFAMPVIAAGLYSERKYIIFATLFSFPVMVSSHLLAYMLKIVSDEPLVTLYGVIVYGLIPRSIEFVACSLVCIAIVSKSSNLINALFEHANKIQQQNESMHNIIKGGNELIKAEGYRQVLHMAVNIVIEACQPVVGNEIILEYRAGYCLRFHDKYYYFLKQDADGSESSLTKLEPASIGLDDKYLYPQDGCRIIDLPEGIVMLFYYNERLLAYIYLKVDNQSKHESILSVLRLAYNTIEPMLTNSEIKYEMVETQRTLVESLAEIAEAKSNQTGSHVKRIGKYMEIICKELGLDKHETDIISMAAMLHDVGKLTIPEAILDKPGKLTEEEFDIIKSHVISGQKLLENCYGDIMQMGKIIALQHHEKWDGNGYLGYAGEDINKYACYAAVIDVFDALISNRSYKSAWTTQDAKDEIIRCKGTHFAPWAVDVFVKVYPQLCDIAGKYSDDEQVHPN